MNLMDLPIDNPSRRSCAPLNMVGSPALRVVCCGRERTLKVYGTGCRLYLTNLLLSKRGIGVSRKLTLRAVPVIGHHRQLNLKGAKPVPPVHSAQTVRWKTCGDGEDFSS